MNARGGAIDPTCFDPTLMVMAEAWAERMTEAGPLTLIASGLCVGVIVAANTKCTAVGGDFTSV